MIQQGDQFRVAVERLMYWQRGGATNFTSLFYDLFAKADPMNRGKLSVAFPAEAAAFSMWHSAQDEDEFFETVLFGKSAE